MENRHYRLQLQSTQNKKTRSEDLENGCTRARLTSEVVRPNENAQAIFEEKMNIIVSLIAKGLYNKDLTTRTEQTWSILSILIGGLNFACAINSNPDTDQIAQTFIKVTIKSTSN